MNTLGKGSILRKPMLLPSLRVTKKDYEILTASPYPTIFYNSHNSVPDAGK